MPADERWNAGGYALQLSLPRAALHASLVGRFDPWIRLNHPPRARRRTMSRQPDGGGRRIRSVRSLLIHTTMHTWQPSQHNQHEHTAAAAAAAGGSKHAQAIVCKHQQASIICRINNTTAASNDI